MTTAQELGTIEKVDIREVWPSEPGHFTPWLGDNLDKLGAELGLELQLVQIEAPVGAYSLDIQARDLRTDNLVVVENQFGSTDHRHLGQLLTYAGGLEASVVVWIAEDFRDEHRAALDFLNHSTGEYPRYFGVKVELWRIGDSLPAPIFNVVVSPNDWQKGEVRVSKHTISERGAKARAFYNSIAERMEERHDFTRNDRSQTVSHASFKSPEDGKHYSVSLQNNKREGPKARVGLTVWDDVALLEFLESDKEAIESEAGLHLNWSIRTDKSMNSIFTDRESSSIDDDPEVLEVTKQWMENTLVKFRDVFDPRIEGFASSQE